MSPLPRDPDPLPEGEGPIPETHPPNSSRTAAAMSSAYVCTRAAMLAFDHDADQRFGARVTYDHAPAVSQFRPYTIDHLAHFRQAVQLGAARHRHIEQHLGKFRHHLLQLTEWAPSFEHHTGDRERRDQPVTGSGVIEEHQVAGLFPTEVVSTAQHFLDHVPVADLHADQPRAALPQRHIESDVAHDRRHHGSVLERAAHQHLRRHHRQDLVAVDDRSRFIDEDGAVRVAVEGDAELRFLGAHGLLETFGMHGAALAVDVGSVRASAHDHHAGSQLAQELRTDPIRRAVGTVDDDLQPGQGANAPEAGLEGLLVSRGGILDRRDPSDVAAGRRCVGGIAAEHQPFDLLLHFVR